MKSRGESAGSFLFGGGAAGFGADFLRGELAIIMEMAGAGTYLISST